jgi:uncharacterized protein (TIGR03086 family)
VTTTLAGSVELLERSLSYTRVILAGVPGADPDLPTPCRDWNLGQLLAHMDDALDAFTEAAGGAVAVPALGWSPLRVERLQEKACGLLGAWSGAPPPGVDVGGAAMSSELLVATAALEITVHGWDVGQALGTAPRIPPDLAERLLVVARQVVGDDDRGVRFAPPHTLLALAPADQRLLAYLGRT